MDLDLDDPACGPADGTTIHIFVAPADWSEAPRERRCLCGETSWGEMNDLRTLTLMWDR